MPTDYARNLALATETVIVIVLDWFISGATRHHLTKATMKDLKLEQTKPVGRIWTLETSLVLKMRFECL